MENRMQKKFVLEITSLSKGDEYVSGYHDHDTPCAIEVCVTWDSSAKTTYPSGLCHCC